MPNSLVLQPGMSLGNGRYVLDRLLKQGRSCLTLQGTQISNGKAVIFKFPLQDQGFLPAHRQRFQHIWQRIGHFQHPYLQQTVDYLEEQGIPCLVLEQIPGRSLAEIGDPSIRSPLAEATALRLIFQIAQGVQQLHDRGLIHGDLKPQNLIQQSQSKAIVVVDWGLFWQGWNSQLSPYSAPEPFTPPEVRVSLDVYSLAACLYTFVTGHPPIAAAQQSTTPLVSPQSLIPDLSPMTQEAILQGMNLDPDRRPQSVQAWLTLLPQPYAPAQLPLVPTANPMPAPEGSSPSQRIDQPMARTVQTRVAIPRSPEKAKSSQPYEATRQGFTAQGSKVFRPLANSLWVITIAGGIGFGLGGFLRWQQSQVSFAPSFFEKSQSFPAKAWPGTLDLSFPEDAPLPETDYAGDGYEPSLDWSPVAPAAPSADLDRPVDFYNPYQPEVPTALPDKNTEEPPLDTGVDPSEPLPNLGAGSFEDPLYAPSEETTPAPPQDSPEPAEAPPGEASTNPPPAEPSPAN